MPLPAPQHLTAEEILHYGSLGLLPGLAPDIAPRLTTLEWEADLEKAEEQAATLEADLEDVVGEMQYEKDRAYHFECALDEILGDDELAKRFPDALRILKEYAS